MPHTTIRIEQFGTDPPRVLFRIYEPDDVPNANILEELNCSVEGPPFRDLASQTQIVEEGQADIVRQAGIEIFKRLSAHSGVKAAFERVSNAVPGELNPIILHMTTEAAEALPFETLFIPDREFLALDDRSPIVRVAMTRETKDRTIERLCELPLRVTTIISAAERHVYEEDEWHALYDAFRSSPIDFKMQVLVGRDELSNIIKDTNDARLEVHTIPDKKGTLVQLIGEFEPTVLHFFCHGTTELAPYLEIARPATHEMGESPLYLSENEIRQMGGSTLLVTLNACEGAAPLYDAYSLALAIANNGVPAVIGMRESIDAQDANIFTNAFYNALLSEFDRVLSIPNGGEPNWPNLLRLPRVQLMERHGGPPLAAAAAHKRWTLPVLYTRPERIHMRRAEGHGDRENRRELRAQLQILRTKRQEFSQDTPQEIFVAIDQRITKLEERLATAPQAIPG